MRRIRRSSFSSGDGARLELGTGMASGVALGAALAGGVALGTALALAAGDPLAAALALGLGAAHCGSGFVFSPHCWQKARILAWSNVSRVRTRPQTMAWNGVDIWSKRAMTGPMMPFGDAAHGLGGKASKNARSWAWPSAVAPVLVRGRGRRARRARGCGSSPAG